MRPSPIAHAIVHFGEMNAALNRTERNDGCLPIVCAPSVAPDSTVDGHAIHTLAELQQQIHDDLRLQHPEWIGLNGESPMCDFYEARLSQLLEPYARA